MEATMQDILDALARMEARLTDALVGRCGEPYAREHTSPFDGSAPPSSIVNTQYRDEAILPPLVHDDAAKVASLDSGNDFGLQQTATVLASLGSDEMSSSTTLLAGSISDRYIPPFYDDDCYTMPQPFVDTLANPDDDLLQELDVLDEDAASANAADDDSGAVLVYAPLDSNIDSSGSPRYPCLPEGAVLFHRDPDEKVLIGGTELSGEVRRLRFSLPSPDQAMNPALVPNTDAEEEEVLTITPTKCLMRVLNRRTYSVPNLPEEKVQNLIRVGGDKLRFPDDRTMFPNSANAYTDDIGRLVLSHGSIHIALDIECGVTSWAAYLLSWDILAMSFALRDSHEARMQFTLVRGVPVMIGVLASKCFAYPTRALHMAHCFCCYSPLQLYDGLYLIEDDRVLHPRGYWILSGPPINWKKYWKGWERTKEDAANNCAHGYYTAGKGTVLVANNFGDDLFAGSNEIKQPWPPPLELACLDWNIMVFFVFRVSTTLFIDIDSAGFGTGLELWSSRASDKNKFMLEQLHRNKMSNRATHGCYACRRPIHLRGQDTICSGCNDGFIQESSEMGGVLNTYGLLEPDFEERRAKRIGMMDAISALIQQQMAEIGRDSLFDIHGRQGTCTEHRRRSTAIHTLIIGCIPSPAVGSSESSDVNIIMRGGSGVRAVHPNFSSLVVGSSLEALFEHLLLQNNRQATPPAPQSAIDSMSIGYNTTISVPQMHAVCLKLLEKNLQPGMRALDVGSGIGLAAGLVPSGLSAVSSGQGNFSVFVWDPGDSGLVTSSLSAVSSDQGNFSVFVWDPGDRGLVTYGLRVVSIARVTAIMSGTYARAAATTSSPKMRQTQFRWRAEERRDAFNNDANPQMKLILHRQRLGGKPRFKEWGMLGVAAMWGHCQGASRFLQL
ncbi:uncharacterized protein [Zea mays]|jgi:hypothetical protein|uniref:uncharacterized protein n=1 Tax=Zea mays TaxID=4577 RepID=UPI0016527964|nr:uncharacterized protein LOC103650430 [Zea mays]